MIPLIVFGSLPRIGCVCADGQHKFLCERHRQGSADGACVCCHPGLTQATSRTPGEKTCCRSEVSRRNFGSPGLDPDRPCRPVVDSAQVLTTAKVVLPLDRIACDTLYVADEFMPPTGRSIVAQFTRGELLPRPDLVVTLGVMLI